MRSAVDYPRSAAEAIGAVPGAQRGASRPNKPLPSTLSSLLMRELTHRINNEFASAISQVSLAAMRSKSAEAKAILSKVMDLLESYLLVHRALQFPELRSSSDAAAYLRRLCLAIGRARLERRNITLVLSECPLRLPSEQCWLLGMILNELITNAARHAFSESGGEIRVDLTVGDRMVECRISDNGSAQPEIRLGRGLNIVSGLAAALEGSMKHQFGPQGSSIVLSFPHGITDCQVEDRAYAKKC